MKHRWSRVVGSALGILAGACTNGKTNPPGPMGPTGVVDLQAIAVNAGAAAQSPRLVQPAGVVAPVTSLRLAAAAPHTIDPTTYRVHSFVSGAAAEVKITIKRIIVEGANGANGALLFGTEDGSGPGTEITLTNGTVDLAAAGLQLNPIPAGHYSRINIWPSRAVKMKGCVTGTFNAVSAMSGPYNGATYTTDALTAGTHTFCTIASKSLLNFENGTAAPTGPVGTDAEFEAQTTPEEIEVDMGEGGPNIAGAYASSAADVRAAVGNIDVFSEFDVDATNPVQLTLVIDLNRMLRFWPNIAVSAGTPNFQPPQPQGYPPGTSYFYTSGFTQALALFTGTPGSIEGYQLNSEICQDLSCVPGSPPDSLSREWMTLIRDSSGAIGAGMVTPDDVPGALFGDVIPTLTNAGSTAGTLRISVGEYRDVVKEHGYLDGFAFKNVGDPEDSCSAYPIMGNGPVDGHGPFPLWYTRKL
jgi:hypothetical protein